MKLMQILALSSALALVQSAAMADDKVVKIGVLTDMSSLYADIGGPNAVLATQMAIEDSGLKDKGWTIDVISADHQKFCALGKRGATLISSIPGWSTHIDRDFVSPCINWNAFFTNVKSDV